MHEIITSPEFNEALGLIDRLIGIALVFNALRASWKGEYQRAMCSYLFIIALSAL